MQLETRSVSFLGALNQNGCDINSDVAIDVKTKKEFSVHVPQIFVFGINMLDVAWGFKSTEEKGIRGNKRDLLLVVRSPKNSKIKGRFLLGAEVEFKLMRVPLSKREEMRSLMLNMIF